MASPALALATLTGLTLRNPLLVTPTIDGYTVLTTTTIAPDGSGNLVIPMTKNSQVVDMEVGNVASLTFTDVPADRLIPITLIVVQNSSGSGAFNWDITSPTAGKVWWPGRTAPTLTLAANAIDIFTVFTYNGGVTFFGSIFGQDMGQPS